MLLNIEQFLEKDKDISYDWLVNRDPAFLYCMFNWLFLVTRTFISLLLGKHCLPLCVNANCSLSVSLCENILVVQCSELREGGSEGRERDISRISPEEVTSSCISLIVSVLDGTSNIPSQRTFPHDQYF